MRTSLTMSPSSAPLRRSNIGVHQAHHSGARTSEFIRRFTQALEHQSSSGAPLRRSNIGVLQAHHSGARTSEFFRHTTPALKHRRLSGAPALIFCSGAHQMRWRYSSNPVLRRCPRCETSCKPGNFNGDPGQHFNGSRPGYRRLLMPTETSARLSYHLQQLVRFVPLYPGTVSIQTKR